MNIELLKEIEKKFSLNESKFLDVNWWQLARYKLNQSYCKSNRANRDVIKFSFKLVFNLIKRSLLFFKILIFLRRKKDKVLILRHARLKYVDKCWIDIYSSHVLEELKSKNIDVIELDPASNIKYETGVLYKRILPLDLQYIVAKILKTLMKIYYCSEKLSITALAELYGESNSVKSADQVKEIVFAYKSHKILYGFLLKIIRPNMIILSERFGNEALIASAKELAINVVELQHGTPIEGKLNYYNDNEASKYLPDYFVTYGGLYKDESFFNFGSSRVFHLGNSHLTRKYNKIKKSNFSKSKDYILFISQPAIDEQLFDWLVRNKKTLQEYKLCVCLHPFYDDKSDSLFCSQDWITVKRSKECDIYIEMMKARYVIGGFSTALYDATFFDCKILIIPSCDHRMMTKFVERGYGEYIKDFDLKTRHNSSTNKIKKAFDFYQKDDFYNNVYNKLKHD